jgi:hypothetical protein
MPVAPFTTNVRDYLGNDYFAVSPFDADIGYRVYLRLHPSAPATGVPGSRTERLARSVEGGRAALELEVGKNPFGPWTPLALVTVERIAQVDGEALRFRPFRDGRGVHPLGFLHAMRLGVYTLSQKARPKQTDERQPIASEPGPGSLAKRGGRPATAMMHGERSM